MKPQRKTIREICCRKSSQLFMSCLLPLVVIGGYFYPFLGFLVLALITLFLILASSRGRFYCGWLCPMGAFHERILTLVSLKHPIPRIFKTSWFRWLVFGIMMGFMLSRLILSWKEPYGVAGVLRTMWIVSTLLAIILGIYFKPRTWCALCPMGSLQGIVSRNTYLLTVASSCIQCKKCLRVCPIETYAGAYRKKSAPRQIPSIECLRCFNCIENCPKNALSFQEEITLSPPP